MSLHLDNFIDSSSGLPTELTRMLTLIRVLDERSAELRQQVQVCVDQFCQSFSSRSSSKVTDEQASAARKEIDGHHTMLIQWADEKLALSVIAAELVDYYLGQLESDISIVQTEMDMSTAEEAAVEAAFNASSAPGMGRRRAWRDDPSDLKDPKRRRLEGGLSGHATPEQRASPIPALDIGLPMAARSHKATSAP